MPPRAANKRAAKKRHDEDEYIAGDEYSEDADEVEEAPKPKPKKRATPAKKKAKKPADSDDLDGSEDDEEEEPKPKKARAAPAPKILERTQLEDGWVLDPPSLIYKTFGTPNSSTKVAAFDLDGTLVNNPSGSKFPLSGDDWALYNPQVATKLQKYHADGYKIVIFTNQGGIKGALAGKASENFRKRVTGLQNALGVPLIAIAATQSDNYRKPDTGMWDLLCDQFMDGQTPSLTDSFFVGDDFNGGDQGFAKGVGIPYREVEHEFGAAELKLGAPADGGPAPVEGSGHNNELVAIFRTLSAQARIVDPAKGHFKAKALSTGAEIVGAWAHTITDKDLAQLKATKGIGKGCLGVIKEYLETGEVKEAKESIQELRARKAGEAAASGAAPSKAAQEAAAFL